MTLTSKSARVTFVFVLFLALLIPISAAFAGSVSGTLNMGVTCTAITTSGGGGVTFDRNTNGDGTETIRLQAFDGLGNVLYDEDEIRPVGTTAVGLGPTFSFVGSPAANPITARFFSPGGNGLPDQVIISATFNCPGLPSVNVPGPGVPAGFVLRTITCETPVYNTAAGQPVGSGMIHAGQTWYVNPTPVDGADGASWTEIFNGGRVNGFILTSCVGG